MRAVAKREAPAEQSRHALARLPPGRHGLSREFVAENQRGRITAGVIAVVAESGYHAATVAAITQAVGVSRRAFYGYFKDKHDCYLDAYGQIEDHLLEAIADAAEEEEEFEAKVQAGLGAMLAAFAENPDLVRFTMSAAKSAGGEPAARYGDFLHSLIAALVGDLPRGAHQPSDAVEAALVGAVTTLIEREVKASRGEQLPKLRGDLSELVLAAYLGPGKRRGDSTS